MEKKDSCVYVYEYIMNENKTWIVVCKNTKKNDKRKGNIVNLNMICCGDNRCGKDISVQTLVFIIEKT